MGPPAGAALTCSHSTARSGQTRTHTRSRAGTRGCARRPPRACRGSHDMRPHTSSRSTLWGQASVTAPRDLPHTAGPCSARRGVGRDPLREAVFAICGRPETPFPGCSVEESCRGPRNHRKHGRSGGPTWKHGGEGLPGCPGWWETGGADGTSQAPRLPKASTRHTILKRVPFTSAPSCQCVTGGFSGSVPAPRRRDSAGAPPRLRSTAPAPHARREVLGSQRPARRASVG